MNSPSHLSRCRRAVALVASLAVAAPSSVLAQQFLYRTEPYTGRLVGYHLNIFTGVLTPVPGSPYTVRAGRVVVDRANRFLYMSESSRIDVIAIDPISGALTAMSSAIVQNPYPP